MKSVRRGFILGWVLALLISGAAWAAPGDLDPSFGVGGLVITDLGSDSDYAYEMAFAADGKIVVAGYSYQGTAPGYDFALARYNPDGSLDPSFGAGGMVTTDLGGFNDQCRGVAITADGKILVSGRSDQPGTNFDFALVRYNADGSLDTSFGSGGIVTTDLGGTTDNGIGLAVAADGKIVVAGYSLRAGTGFDFALVRYNPDGSLDPGFGTGGFVTTDFGGTSDFGYAVAIATDGKILAGGQSDQGATGFDFALARYNPDGSPDAGFGAGGIVTTDLGGGDDTSLWGGLAIAGDGKIVMSGRSDQAILGTDHDFALVRYNPDGSLDPGFGAGGIVTTDLGGNYDYGWALTLATDGRILVAGNSNGGTTGQDFALASYNPDGSLDTEFGTGGIVTTDLGGNSDYGYDVAIDADGQILVAGFSYQGAPREDFALVRYAGLRPPPAGSHLPPGFLEGLLTRIAPPGALRVPPLDYDGNFYLFWGESATPGATYVLEESTDRGFSGLVRTVYTGPGNSVMLTGRTPGRLYYYRVRAINSYGTESAWVRAGNGIRILASQALDPAQATVSVPAAPQLSLTVVDRTVSGQWNRVAGAEGYRVHLAPYPYNGEEIVSLDLGNVLSQAAEFPAGSAYYIALTAYNGEGESDYSNIGVITIE